MELFGCPGRGQFIIKSVPSPITHLNLNSLEMLVIPTCFSSHLLSVGNFIPISQVREDVASAYCEELEWRARNMLLPFKKMCAQRQVN